MHPLEKICEEFKITLYRLSQISGIAESTLRNIIKNNTSPKRIAYENFKKMAVGLGMGLLELEAKFDSYN